MLCSTADLMVVWICRGSQECLAVAEGHGHGSSLSQPYCVGSGDRRLPPAIWCEATWPPGFSLLGVSGWAAMASSSLHVPCGTARSLCFLWSALGLQDAEGQSCMLTLEGFKWNTCNPEHLVGLGHFTRYAATPSGRLWRRWRWVIPNSFVQN